MWCNIPTVKVVGTLKACNWMIFNKIVFPFKCPNYSSVGRWINVYKYREVNGRHTRTTIILTMGYFHPITMVKDISPVLKFA